jgi:hypothetical protein
VIAHTNARRFALSHGATGLRSVSAPQAVSNPAHMKRLSLPMVYIFDPTHWNGTIFLFEKWSTLGDHTECRRANKPIPASYFPKSLTVADASAVLPDIFHTYRDIIIFSEKARLIMEE